MIHERIVPSMTYDTINNDVTMAGGAAGALGRIDKYELRRELGEGGFGTVYLAHDTVADVDVAVKGLPPEVKHNAVELESIRGNFALVKRLRHPNIVAVTDLHQALSVSYASKDVESKLRVFERDTMVVMDYAPGVTLAQWRRQFPGGKVPLDKAIAVVRQIASALDYAHGQKVLHRDVKPANVMVESADGGKLVARVLDFGLAAEIRSSMGRLSREIRDTSGTRPYMAPEQWLGHRQGPATDQYSLAVLFHELVIGEVPFASVFDTGDPIVMLNAVANNPVELPEDFAPAVKYALSKALAKKPGDRFASCADFVDALGGKIIVEPPSIGGDVTKKGSAPAKRALQSPVWIIVAVFLFAALAGIAGWLLRDDGRNNYGKAEATSQFGSNEIQRPVAQSVPVDEALKGEVHIMKGKAGQARDRNAREEWRSWPYFDVHAKDVEAFYRAGVDAFDKDDYKLAKEMFGKVRENMYWLSSNKVMRVSAAVVREKALASKREAEGLEPGRFASPEWNAAAVCLSDAERLFEEGQFRQAESHFASADDAFKLAKEVAQSAKATADRKNATAKFFAAYNEKRYDDAAKLRHDIDLNDATVQFDLGYMYANGKGVEEDAGESVKWYRQAAKNGILSAMFNLGVMYSTGKGVAKDLEEGEKWYKMAAEHGYEKAKDVLQKKENARVAKEARENAERKLEAAKKQLDAKKEAEAERLYKLGEKYAKGDGVDADDAKAIRYFTKAAAAGSKAASIEIARIRGYVSQRFLEIALKCQNLSNLTQQMFPDNRQILKESEELKKLLAWEISVRTELLPTVPPEQEIMVRQNLASRQAALMEVNRINNVARGNLGL